MQYELQPPASIYYHGWGHECADPKLVKCTWTLKTQDNNTQPVEISFDLTEGSAPLIIGIDFLQFTDTFNRQEPRVIRFKRPTDVGARTMFTYIAPDRNGNNRLRLEVIPQSTTSYRSLLSAHHDVDSTTLVAKMHRFSHAHSDDMKAILSDAGRLDEGAKRACEEVFKACPICATTGRPAQHRKVSLTHVNEEFNQELQADFTIAYIRGAKYEVLNFNDTGTRYGERAIATTRSADTIRHLFETKWMYHHGAPQRFSADPEFCRPVLRRFLDQHNVDVLPRPSRSSHKNGRIERNNGVFKLILERVAKADSKASVESVISRASFLTNCIRGSKQLSAFQLVRGYRPSVSGIPARVVSQELIDAYISHEATRALNRLLTARIPTELAASKLSPGTRILVYYKSSKQNERDGWINATVVSTTEHAVICRRSNIGAPMSVAYGDVRLIPDNDLAKRLALTDATDEDGTNTEDEAGSQIHTLMSTALEDPAKDIGLNPDDREPTPTGDLSSDEDKVLSEIRDTIGTTQVNRKRLEGAPAWIVQKALDAEHNDNWKEAYEEIAESNVSRGENVIASHVVYKLKVDEEGKMKLKARICPHGNRDIEKDDVRKDSATAQFDTIRMALSMSTRMSAVLGHVDIKGAYLQSGPIKRTIYVRPPRELAVRRGTLWKLTKLPYGITEAGRQWAIVFEEWLTHTAALKRVSGVDQLFVKRDTNGLIVLLMAKVTDDLLMVGTKADLEEFVTALGKRFPISKSIIDATIRFNGSTIQQEPNGDVTISMTDYAESLQYLELTRDRRKQNDEKATAEEFTAFKSLTGEIMWLGGGVSPQASFVASYLQQRTSDLRVSHLTEANKLLRQLKALPTTLRYKKLTTGQGMEVYSFADASFNIAAGLEYGQTGVIIGLRTTSTQDNAFHMIDWISHKQRRISHSAYGAEILACADGDDRGYHIKNCVSELIPDKTVTHTLHVDSRGLFDTITTLHNGREYRLRQTVQRIRDSFEAKETDVVRWIQRKANLADALTKWSPEMNRTLTDVITSGRLLLPEHEHKEHSAANWK